MFRFRCICGLKEHNLWKLYGIFKTFLSISPPPYHSDQTESLEKPCIATHDCSEQLNLNLKKKTGFNQSLKKEIYHFRKSLFRIAKIYDLMHCPKRSRSGAISLPSTHSNKQKLQSSLYFFVHMDRSSLPHRNSWHTRSSHEELLLHLFEQQSCINSNYRQLHFCELYYNHRNNYGKIMINIVVMCKY